MADSNEYTAAFESGYRALRENGKGRDANPFDTGSAPIPWSDRAELMRAWLAGWQKASRECFELARAVMTNDLPF
jgi:hypothetical protein